MCSGHCRVFWCRISKFTIQGRGLLNWVNIIQFFLIKSYTYPPHTLPFLLAVEKIGIANWEGATSQLQVR
jgi:hypothetical protein